MKLYEGAIALLTIGLILMTLKTIEASEKAVNEGNTFAAVAEINAGKPRFESPGEL